MATREKMLLSAAALYLLSGAIAYADGINVELNLGQPAYAEPYPAYVAPYPTYYDPRHRDHDFGYWQRQRREHWHQDNGRHEGRNDDRRGNTEQWHGNRGHM